MIEQLPQAFISHEQFDDALYPAQLRACRAARAHLPQPTIVLHMRDQRATKFPQHGERHRHQREHPGPCFKATDTGLGKTEQPLGITKDFLDGLITNDKFCFTRHCQLKLNWWRRPLRLRHSALLNNSLVHSGGNCEAAATAVEHSTPDSRAHRRRTSPRSGLPTPSAMGTGTIHRTTDAGGEP